MVHTANAVQVFARHKGRPPMEATIGVLILRALIYLNAEREDVQWFVDADLMPPTFVDEWERARG